MTSSSEGNVVQITPPAESLLITHTQDHEAYKCSEKLCSFTTTSPSLLGIHKAQIHKIKTGTKKGIVHHYFCPAPGCGFNSMTGRFFKVLDHLKTHYTKVHSEKRFKCTKCTRAFGLERDCLRHEKVCGQIFTCSDCGKEYGNKPALSMHCLSKGHTPPPSAQKVPKKTKGESKCAKTKAPQKDIKKEVAVIPILPKFPLPSNMSILIPANRNNAAQSVRSVSGAPTSLHPTPVPNGYSESSSSSISCRDIRGIGTSLAFLSFNNASTSSASSSTPMVHSIVESNMIDSSCQGTTSLEKTGRNLNTLATSIKTFDQSKEIGTDQRRFKKGTSKRSLPKQPPNHSSIGKSCIDDQHKCIKTMRSLAPSSNLVSESQEEKSIYSSKPYTVIPLSMASPMPTKLTVLPSGQMLPASNVSTMASVISNQFSSSINANAHCSRTVLPLMTAISDNGTSNVLVRNQIGVDKRKGQNLRQPQQQKQLQLQPHLVQDVVIQSEEAQNDIDISSLSFDTFNSEVDMSYHPTSSKPNCLSFSSAHTQTAVSPISSCDLVNDSETQTLESFMLDSLNSLLTDCETQTLENCLPLYDLVHDSGTQTHHNPTSDSVSQTLAKELSESTSQTSLMMNPLELDPNLLPHENPLCFASEDNNMSCQIDPEDLLAKTFDGMAQTSNEQLGATLMQPVPISNTCTIPTNRSASPITSLISTMLKSNDSTTQTRATGGDADSSTQTLLETLSAMTQTTGSLGAGVQSSETFDSMTQTLDEYESLADLADGLFNSSEKPPCTDRGHQTGVSDDCMTQTSNSLHTMTQTSDFFDSMTQTPTNAFDSLTQSANSFDIMTQTADFFNSMTQTAAYSLDSMTQTEQNLNIMTQTAANSFDSMTQTAAYSLDSMTQTADLFGTMTPTANSFDMMSQAVPSNSMTQSINVFDSVTQTVNNFDNTSQTVNSLDNMTQTADFFDSMTQTTNIFDSMTQTTNILDSMTQTTNIFDSMTQTTNIFDSMTQTTNIFDSMTQTTNNLDNMTQTANSLDMMTQTADFFDSMTQTANSFDNSAETTNLFDNMTQTANGFGDMTQTENIFNNITQTANRFDNMTQTVYNFDNMTQTVYNFDNVTQTANIFDNNITTQTVNNFDNMTQTANGSDTMTQTDNSFEPLVLPSYNFVNFDLGCDTFTQTGECWDTMTQTDQTITQNSGTEIDPDDRDLWELFYASQQANRRTQLAQISDNSGLFNVSSQTENISESDITTQTMEMINQTERDLMSDMMTQTQTGSNNLWEMTTQTDQTQGSNMMTQTQTGTNDLWEMTTQTDQAQGSNMMTQTQTGSNDLWEMTTQTDQAQGSNMMTQTQTGSTGNDLWEMTTQTDELQGSNMMTQTQTPDDGNHLWEMMSQTDQDDLDIMSNMMTQTGEIDFWDVASQTNIDLSTDTLLT